MHTVVTHKATPLYCTTADKYTWLWTTRGLQLARPGDWVVTAPTGCTWRIRKKHHKFYNTGAHAIRSVAQ